MPLVGERRPSESKFRAYFSDDFSDEDSEKVPTCKISGGLMDKEFDPVTFDVLKVEPEHFASQLTLLDLPVFKQIQPEELTSCAWNTKDKLTVAPNVVAFTRRFNHVCLWCQKEVLSNQKVKLRADVLTHFIKIAKRLVDLNNLHSAFAIISGLQSLPLYRLTKTWAALPGKEKSSFDRLAKLFGEENNFERLRKHIEHMKLPSIPYLGLYLTDLIYIDVAHPSSGGLDSNQRSLQMNNILRVLADFQQSNYDHLQRIDCILTYLNSVRYIDELQKFVEEDLYKLSRALEPDGGSRTTKQQGSIRRQETAPGAASSMTVKFDSDAAAPLKDMYSKTQSLTPQMAHFKPAHRKTQSLGSNSAFRNESFVMYNESFPASTLDECPRHLLDDSLLDCVSCTTSSASSHAPLPECADDSGHETADEKRLEMQLPGPVEERHGDLDILTGPKGQYAFTFQGPVRRKTLLKEGKRPTVSPWKRYWLGLWGTNLFYFSERSLPIRNWGQREAYKSKPTKMLSISGWMVLKGDDPFNPDCFQIQEPSRGNVYKFRAGTQAMALEWVKHLKEAAEKYREKLPTNLMSFE